MNTLRTTLLTLILAAGVEAPAAIIHVDIPEGDESFLGLGDPISREFDFNQDNTVDLRFTASRDGFVVTALHSGAGIATGFLSRNNFAGTTAVPLQEGWLVERYSEDFDRDPFAIEITPGGGEPKTYLLSFGGLDSEGGGAWSGEEAFLGFALSERNPGELANNQFGWLKIREFGGTGGFFLEYAYETEFNIPIVAGAIPEPGTALLGILSTGFLICLRRRS